MGVISLNCTAMGESFLGISADTNADFNSIRFKLSSGGHPNQKLQSRWNQYGESGFEFFVLKVLKYDNPRDDHIQKLEALREQCFAADPQAERIWR